MLTALAISNYRSLRKLVVPLQRLNVITGANGSGKSSLYVRSGFLPIRPKAALYLRWLVRVGCNQLCGLVQSPFRVL
jgi:hypothetical protein